MSFDRYVLPLGLCAAVAALAALVHAVARVRRPGGDTGDLWANVLRRWGTAVAIAGLLSCSIAPVWQKWWQTGAHLQVDRVFPSASAYRAALVAPFALFALVVLFSAASRPAPRAKAWWVAGGIGFSSSRAWILLAAAPLALMLLSSISELGGGPDAYPAALWGALATILVTLAAIAASRGSPPPLPSRAAVAESAPVAIPLPPWPEALHQQGVLVEPLVSWPKSPPPSGAPQGPTQELWARLRARGAQQIAPQAWEVVDLLLQSPSSSRERSCLFLAPDGAGQTEMVAVLADTLLTRSREATLIVTPNRPDSLLAQVSQWLSPGTRASVARPDHVLSGDDIWIVDADTLSDSLLPRLTEEAVVGRIGLVVWWDLHAYTGVLAANMWALSRRLDRLIRALGREDVRTLALIRSSPDPRAQLGRYVRRLLPYDFREIAADRTLPRDVAAYRVGPYASFFNGSRSFPFPVAARHPTLVAAFASVQSGYATYVDAPPEVTRTEWDLFARMEASGSAIRQRLAPFPDRAGAIIRQVRSADVLSLFEILCQAGRAAPSGAPAYAGLVPPSNPYARYALASFARAPGLTESRRLVGAESRPRIIERHLLLALSELEDTRTSLRSTSLWNEDVVRKTLDRLDQEGKLRSFETRWLGKDGRLCIDRVYKSLKSPPPHICPLDAAGIDPVPVRDVSAKDGGVRLMVDRERLPIAAYPGRVFVREGTRYEVRHWESMEQVAEQGWVECHEQDSHRVTWRKRDVRLADVTPTKAPVRAAQAAHPLVRQPADVVYEETVRGAMVVDVDLTTGSESERQTSLGRPIRTRFETQALLLDLPEAPDRAAVASVAQALRHVLPVHLGVEEDAVEVVPLLEGKRGRVAIVDLFPGGIGVVAAIIDDDAFLLALLVRCHDWLVACACKKAFGCRECLRSVEAAAANPDDAHRRDAALGVLSKMIPQAASQRGRR